MNPSKLVQIISKKTKGMHDFWKRNEVYNLKRKGES